MICTICTNPHDRRRLSCNEAVLLANLLLDLKLPARITDTIIDTIVRSRGAMTPAPRASYRYNLGPVCDAGTCTRPRGHRDGTHDQFDGPNSKDNLGSKALKLGCVICGTKAGLTLVVTNKVRAYCEKDRPRR